MLHDWDWRGAEASFARALELAPGNSTVLHRASVLAGSTGRIDDAITLARQAVEQDPLSASSYFFLGLLLWSADCPLEAIDALRKTLELAPRRAAAHANLSCALIALDRPDEAMAEALREPEEWGRLLALAIVHHAARRDAESDEALSTLVEMHANDAAYQIAEVQAVRGEANSAFEWLERAYVQRDPGVTWTKVDPLLRSLHADPRWGVFMRKMKLAD
jgi:tetratricopeptide (TPR) repeat protein